MYHFRKVIEDDFQKICNLIETKDELFLVYPNGQYPFTVKQIYELSKTRKELTVVTYKDQIIGFANFYSLIPKQSAFIGNVIIKKNFRNKGIAKKLINYMLNIAIEKYQFKEIKISVFNYNTKALLLYHNLGFQPFDIEERINNKKQRVALIHMQKRLLN